MNTFLPLGMVLLVPLAGGCGDRLHDAGTLPGYRWTSPDAVYRLPDELREISGLAFSAPSTLLCVQDEQGVLFAYDLAERRTSVRRVFGLDGDYEGIAVVNATAYVLRSDGVLVEVSLGSPTPPQLHTTGIPSKNNEGLCYDASGHRLLVAAKSRSGKEPQFKGRRMVYAFDLGTKTLQKSPVLVIDEDDLASRLRGARPAQAGGDGGLRPSPAPDIAWKPSAIGVHPRTGRLYLLSASGPWLVVASAEGEIEQVVPLDPALFPKAEGLAFSERGDLFISNEGVAGPATILRFNLRDP